MDQFRKRLLFLIADDFPTHRPDVVVLFGRLLPTYGIFADVVAQLTAAHRGSPALWPPGRAYLAQRHSSRVLNQLGGLMNDVRALWHARANDYDGIQVRDKVFAGLLALCRAKSLRRPFFYWMSFPMSESFIDIAGRGPHELGWVRWLFLLTKGHLGKILLYHTLLPYCDHVFVQSDEMAARLTARGIRPERVTAVPMGVDLDSMLELRDPPADFVDHLSGRTVIAYQGSLDRSRRIDILFEVLAAVRERAPQCCLLLVGDAVDPKDLAWLHSRAQAIGVAESVVWTGWLPTTQAWAILRQATIGVSVIPRGEIFDCSSPTKVVEYLALGLPVVANDIPDQARVIADSGAGVCVSSDSRAVADAIIHLLADPIRLAEMAQAGPAYVSRHRSYDVLSEQLTHVYRQLFST